MNICCFNREKVVSCLSEIFLAFEMSNACSTQHCSPSLENVQTIYTFLTHSCKCKLNYTIHFYLWRVHNKKTNNKISKQKTYFRIITKTCQYNFDPLEPHLYMVKLGFTGVYIIFLFLLKNIDCRRGGSNEYPQSMFWVEIWKNIRIFYLKSFIFGR